MIDSFFFNNYRGQKILTQQVLWCMWQLTCDVCNKWNKLKKTSLLETLRNYYLKLCILYINELVQELLDNTSIFYYDAHFGVNVITLEPLLTGNK